MLFDAAQEELFSQFDALGDDAQQAESLLLNLSAFRRIARVHLLESKPGEPAKRNVGEGRWLALLRELDESEVRPENELQGNARAVLMAVRKKGHAAQTWVECYQSHATVVSADGQKRYQLKREVTHAIHNAAKAATYQLAKIWAAKPKK